MSYLIYQHYRKDKGEVFYVGISSNIKRPYKKSNRSSFWKKIINKTDYDVEILFNDLTKIQAEIIEKELIKFYGRRDLGTGTLCNLTDGGEGGSLGIIQSEETREKKRQASLGNQYAKGYKHTKEAKEKISNRSKNKNDKQIKASANNLRNWSTSTKHKEMLSKIKSKPICLLNNKKEIIQIFKSLTEASKKLGVSVSKISLVCSGKRNHTGGFVFKYLKDE